jgi:hypothetical protein
VVQRWRLPPLTTGSEAAGSRSGIVTVGVTVAMRVMANMLPYLGSAEDDP